MFALMNPDLTFSGQINDGTNSIQWNGMTLPPLRLMTKSDRVENFVYDFVPALSVPQYHTAGGTTYAVDEAAKTVNETVDIIPWDAPKIAQYKIEVSEKIDLAAETARVKYVSPGIYVQQEYLQAEADALSFVAAPTGSCPLSVSCWAEANVSTAMTNLQAAQNIVAIAVQFRYLLNQIRSIRLLGKSNVASAADGAAIDAVYDQVKISLGELP